MCRKRQTCSTSRATSPGTPAARLRKTISRNFFKVFLFSSESQVSMVAQYGSLASLEQVRIPKFFNFDVIIVH